ncbi:MAG TPA: hypothetical protein VFO25_05240 [Candidatus Eremiobacteraceae bacterium]|nr:hypothetical protein [Candidatus Eremiobacteraceae bacterium]
MRISSLMTIAAASAVIAFAGCSANSTSSVAPSAGPAGQARTTHSTFGHTTSVLPPALAARVAHPVRSDARLSHNSCPSSGTLIYLSDAINGVVNIYDGTLTMCGQLSGFVEPQGMTVVHGNLYVANTLGNPNGTGEIDEFHRGATAPFRKFTDPSGQYVVDVAVTSNAVIGSNIFSPTTGIGSISGFTRSGTFVSNTVLPNMLLSYFVGSMDNGTLFGDGFDSVTFTSTFWTFTCPGGACTSGTELGQAMSFPGGIVDTQSADVLASDQTGNTADTFEMPSLSPATFTTDSGGDVVTLDELGAPGDRPAPTGPVPVYGADAAFNELVCFMYKQNGSSPSGCGSVAGNAGGQALGVAVDAGS